MGCALGAVWMSSGEAVVFSRSLLTSLFSKTQLPARPRSPVLLFPWLELLCIHQWLLQVVSGFLFCCTCGGDGTPHFPSLRCSDLIFVCSTEHQPRLQLPASSGLTALSLVPALRHLVDLSARPVTGLLATQRPLPLVLWSACLQACPLGSPLPAGR